MTAPYTVALDCDGVLFDFVRAFQRAYDEGLPHDLKLGEHWMPEQWDISKDRRIKGSSVGYKTALVYSNPNLAFMVKPYPYAAELLRRLHATGARLIFATAPMKSNYPWCYWRAQACKELCEAAGVPDLPVVFTHDKTLVAANALVDDRVTHARAFHALNGRIGILFDQPYNRAESVPFRMGPEELVEFVTHRVALRGGSARL